MKKGQVTIFIIIAIVVVAAALAFVYLRRPAAIHSELQPVEDYFVECIADKVKEATSISGLQAGYVQLPEFEPGSSYMPFSNQLIFQGLAIPYWFYVSGNNLHAEQKPSLSQIQDQFSSYVEEGIEECSLSLDMFSEQGFIIEVGELKSVGVRIKDQSIETEVQMPLKIQLEDFEARIEKHEIRTKSKFGLLYKRANSIFEKEMEDHFLENYALDVIYMYAPTTSVELSCAPLVWLKSSVESEVKDALTVNFERIKVKGNYYRLESNENKYFVVDVGENFNEQANFLFSRDWQTRFEVWPTEDGLLRADPVGLQPGLSFLGFCYVPYHFVYDLSFPVIVQLRSEDEFFQFPVLVVVDKNKARSAEVLETSSLPELCQHKDQPSSVYTSSDGKAVEAQIYFKCFNQVCEIGKTKMSDGVAGLTALFPKCVNGFIIARADGYAESKLQVSSNEPFSASMFLRPEYKLDIEADLGRDEYAIIIFSSETETESKSLFYPEQKELALSEGAYDVSAYLFKKSTMQFEKQKIEKCVEVPYSGIQGLVRTKEECFELDLPSSQLTNVIFGGGTTKFYPSDSELKRASKLQIKIPSFDVPENVLELQDIYYLIDESSVSLKLR